MPIRIATPILSSSPYIPVIINRTVITTVSNTARTVKKKKTKKEICHFVRIFLSYKPMKKKQQHNNIVDLEPTSSSSFEENMVIESVIQIDYSKTVQHKQETRGFNNRHDSKFHKSS